jgi:hypothetical protein
MPMGKKEGRNKMKEKNFGCILLIALIGMGILVVSAEASQKYISDSNVSLEQSEIISTNVITGLSNNPNFDQVVKSYEQNLTKSQLKLSTALLQLTDPSFPINKQRDFNTWNGTYGALIKTGTLKPADHPISDGSVSGDLILVSISLNPGSPINSIDNYLYQKIGFDNHYYSVAAWVRIENISKISEIDNVRFIDNPVAPINYRGSVTTQGDAIHRTNEVRATYDASGTGVKVGVISSGAANIPNSQSTGDLPYVNVLHNNLNSAEGTAMMEVVYDMAPNANLYFYDQGVGTAVAMNTAIDNLVANGCKIICDDVGLLDEPYFEDGSVASHMNSLSNSVVFVSAAGDLAQRHYQGIFSNQSGGNIHDFNPTNKYLYVDVPSQQLVQIVLQWNDPWASSSNNYDLDLIDTSNNQLLAYSHYPQNGGSYPPKEVIQFINYGAGNKHCKIQITRISGIAKTLELFVVPLPLTLSPSSNIIPSDSIIEHQAASNVIAVAAVDQVHPDGPNVESYSSLGPSTINYPSYQARSKPDITGVDSVATTIHNPYAGTSASAPHIAGIIADIWSLYPTKTAQEIRTAVQNSAVDLGPSGFDYSFGYGRGDAMRMLEQFNPTLWATTTIDSTANSGQFSSMKLNNGYPGIASFTGAGGLLKYNWKDDSGWHMETAFSDPNGADDTSLGYNAGYPAVSFHLRGTYYDYVKYAWRTVGGWNNENVNQLGGFEGTGESLAFNNGYPSISYCDRYTGNVYYAYKDGSGWHNSAIKYEQDLDYLSSLAFNSGNPGISYAAVPSGAMMSAQNNTHMFAPYPFQRNNYVMASNSSTNTSSSREVMLLSTPMSLRYTWKDTSGWHFETVDPGSGSTWEGGYSSLAYFNGYPRISYIEWLGGASCNLKYAYKDGSGWHTELVDSGIPSTAAWTSLSIDSAGYPKISYYANGPLKYAYKDASGWHNQIVDSTGGSYTSSVVDTSGKHPKISYSSGSHLKYAYK